MKNALVLLVALTVSSLAQAADYTCTVTGVSTRSYMKSGIDVTSNDATSASGTVVLLDRVQLYAHIDIRTDTDRPGYQDVTLRLTKTNADPAPGDDSVTGITPIDEKELFVGSTINGQAMGVGCQKI